MDHDKVWTGAAIESRVFKGWLIHLDNGPILRASRKRQCVKTVRSYLTEKYDLDFQPKVQLTFFGRHQRLQWHDVLPFFNILIAYFTGFLVSKVMQEEPSPVWAVPAALGVVYVSMIVTKSIYEAIKQHKIEKARMEKNEEDLS